MYVAKEKANQETVINLSKFQLQLFINNHMNKNNVDNNKLNENEEGVSEIVNSEYEVDMSTFIEEMNLHSSSKTNFLLKLDIDKYITVFHFSKILKG